MKKERSVFICAWEYQGQPTEEAELLKQPVLLCIQASILLAAAQLTALGDPPPDIKQRHFASGPIVWSDALGRLTFYAWYWSKERRDFRAVRLYAVEQDMPFIDGERAYKLMGGGGADGGNESIESLALSLGAMEKLARTVAKRSKFAIAAERGVSFFTDFEAFEYKFNGAVCVNDQVPQACAVDRDSAMEVHGHD